MYINDGILYWNRNEHLRIHGKKTTVDTENNLLNLFSRSIAILE